MQFCGGPEDLITKTICQLQNFSLNRSRMEVLQVFVLGTDETVTIETAEQGPNAPARLCSVWIRDFRVHLRT